MADTVATQWIHPANWDGTLPDTGGWRRVILHMTSLSDGTGETDVVKVDLSSLQTTSGTPPTRSVIEWIKYQLNGMGVRLEWDRAPHAKIAELNSNTGIYGELDFCDTGGLVDLGDSSDRTGDIILTTVDALQGSSYDITMSLRLKDD